MRGKRVNREGRRRLEGWMTGDDEGRQMKWEEMGEGDGTGYVLRENINTIGDTFSAFAH